MKTVWLYLKNYLEDNFNGKYYLLTGLFTALLIWFNYALDFENSYIDYLPNGTLRILAYAGFEGCAFLGSLLLLKSLGLGNNFLFSKEFWIKFLLGFLLLGAYRVLNFRDLIAAWTHNAGASLYLARLSRFMLKIFFLGVPLYLFYRIYDRRHLDSFYGLSFKSKSFGIYAQLLLTMVFVIGIASFFESITDYYPRYLRSGYRGFMDISGWSPWLTATVYEGSYAVSFLAVEVFFRGFLVLGFARLVGPQVVLAMASCYAVLHFGKPLPETISSVFGGYILGVLSLQSKNIWGGVFLHGGIALLMEFFAYLQLMATLP